MMKEKGIDVSAFQGNIDWNKVKASGIKYAILKFGNIYDYDANWKDSKFETNYSECQKLGIPVGIYVYNYCNTIDTLKKGITWLFNNLGHKKLQLPIYLDMEDKDIQGETKATLTAQCNEFAKQIVAQGYRAGVYANTNWLLNELTPSDFNKGISVWVAQYNSECEYEGVYDIWQYTSKGSIPGITGNVDVNYMINDIINISTKPEPPDTEETPDKYNDGVINCIYDIQEWLNNKYNFGIEQDDMYGPETHSALVKAFQTELNKQFNAGLDVDGVFGLATKNACIIVNQGSQGNITMIIQMMLFIKGYNISLDKTFGSETLDAVKRFQKSKGLTVDGRVGPNTFEKLLE